MQQILSKKKVEKALGPCPFCKTYTEYCDDVMIVYQEYHDIHGVLRYTYRVKCNMCTCLSGDANDLLYLMRVWNDTTQYNSGVSEDDLYDFVTDEELDENNKEIIKPGED